jgi:hypothetical protein
VSADTTATGQHKLSSSAAESLMLYISMSFSCINQIQLAPLCFISELYIYRPPASAALLSLTACLLHCIQQSKELSAN